MRPAIVSSKANERKLEQLRDTQNDITDHPVSGGNLAEGTGNPMTLATVKSQAKVAKAKMQREGHVGASSEELIQDLEAKIRKIVEQKRTESDRLRFILTKRREEVKRSNLVLQGLVKESEALGLHYISAAHNDEYAESGSNQLNGLKNEATVVREVVDEAPDRLQPITSVSRRPVYSKHTSIAELESRLEKRAKEAHEVQRRTLVLEHIKRRLMHERLELNHTTMELKTRYNELCHYKQELCTQEIAAAEAVSQIQSRLSQQKEDMAANTRKHKRELAMREKWAREKAKFDKYCSDQMRAFTSKQENEVKEKCKDDTTEVFRNSLSAKGSISASHIVRQSSKRGSNDMLRKTRLRRMGSIINNGDDERERQQYHEAFQRLGFALHADAVDPHEIIQLCLSHNEIRRELDSKHEEETHRAKQLQDSISKLRSVAAEGPPLSKRGTSQRVEMKEIELAEADRELATVIDQYTYVNQSVQPIKIGLQQIVQNFSKDSVSSEDIQSLERTLLASCEEMMAVVRRNPDVFATPSSGESCRSIDSPSLSQLQSNNPLTPSKGDEELEVDYAETFTSPYNIRVTRKEEQPYYARGISTEVDSAPDSKDKNELNFDVMDRATVKRVSSVLVCTSAAKKSKDEEDKITTVPSYSLPTKSAYLSPAKGGR